MNWDTSLTDPRIGTRELAFKIGRSHRSIPRFVKEKRGFPQPEKICGRNTWRMSVVDAWIAAEIERNRSRR